MKRILGVAALCATLILAFSIVTGCDGSNDSGSTTSTGGPNVGILPNSGVAADPIEIQVGESVTWRNQDPLTHWLVGEGGIDSGELKQYYSYTKVFDKAGTYPYECKLHQDLKGKVVVK